MVSEALVESTGSEHGREEQKYKSSAYIGGDARVVRFFDFVEINTHPGGRDGQESVDQLMSC